MQPNDAPVTPLSPQALNELELQLAKEKYPFGYPEKRWLATVRDRERERDQERHVRETAERESLHHAERTAQLYLERDELQRQLAKVQHDLTCWQVDHSTCDARKTYLIDQLVEARKDTERLDWLSDYWRNDVGVLEDREIKFTEGVYIVREKFSNHLREALDAARIAQGQDHPKS